jgi:hypothetical protein
MRGSLARLSFDNDYAVCDAIEIKNSDAFASGFHHVRWSNSTILTKNLK